MADLAASDVTVTLQTTAPRNPVIQGLKKYADVKITFGDSALTYPAGGVPMPTYEKYGLTRNLDFLSFYDANDASALMVKYDAENNKLRLYNAGAELAGDAVPAQTLYALAVGW